jgi:hypothetical protein
MKSIIKISILGLVVLFTGVAVAAITRELSVSGQICQATSGSVTIGQFGVQNNSNSTSATVLCPLQPVIRSGHDARSYLSAAGSSCTFDPIRGPHVTFYDRHSTQDVSCTLRSQWDDGTISFTSTVSSSSSGAAAQSRFWSTGGDRETMFGESWVVSCTIPPVENGAVSHVTSFVLQYCDAT